MTLSAISDFSSHCAVCARDEDTKALAPLGALRDTLIDQTRNLTPDAGLAFARETSASLNQLPLYALEPLTTANRNAVLDAWNDGPRGAKWTWAVGWMPALFPPWAAPASWDLASVPEDQIDLLLAYLLRQPAGWQRPLESDEIARFYEKLLPQIRSVAARATPSHQALIDKAVLRYLDIGYALFGFSTARACARARAELLQDCLQRLHPELSLSSFCASLPRRDNKIKLGIIIRYFKPFIDSWLLAGFLKDLPRDKFLITVYSVQDVDGRIDPTTPEQIRFKQRFLELVDSYVPLDKEPLETSVRIIRADANDVMLLGNSMHIGTAKAHLLQAYRLAKVQIATIISSCTCAFDSVDSYLSHPLTEPAEGAQDHYTEKLDYLTPFFDAMALDPSYETSLTFAANDTDRAFLKEAKIPLDVPLLSCGSGWPKLGQDVIGAWARILKEAPTAHLILYPGSPSWRRGWFAVGQHMMLQRQMQAHGIDLARIHVLPPLNIRQMLTVATVTTLYLDAFPYSGNMGLREPLLMGCPVLTRENPHQRGMQAAGVLRLIGAEDLVTVDTEAYCRRALELLKDTASLTARRPVLRNAMQHSAIYDPRALGASFGAWLQTACR